MWKDLKPSRTECEKPNLSFECGKVAPFENEKGRTPPRDRGNLWESIQVAEHEAIDRAPYHLAIVRG